MSRRLSPYIFAALAANACPALAADDAENPMISAENSATTTSTLEADTTDKIATKADATAVLSDARGTSNGTVTFTEGPAGLLATIEVNGLTPGWHAIHVHEKADCTAPDFKSTGNHAAPIKHKHGYMIKGGMHAGDMPNIWVRDDGIAKAQAFMPGIFLKTLLDKDGAAVIIHAKADDYTTQPTGDAGDRISCGPITAKAKPAKKK